ncbi:MAG: VOC family protein, partial [Firmicutes bacterium]|nr:VOC family protein [Bacillota bacterium]
MKFQNPLLVVTDMEASKNFYKDVLGLDVILDFGANVTLAGGLCLQT